MNVGDLASCHWGHFKLGTVLGLIGRLRVRKPAHRFRVYGGRMLGRG